MAERFLVVDDDHASRGALRRLLQMWDHEVATAESAEEALDALDRWRPSAVFTDLVMPGMDGIAFARRVKSEYGIPVVVFSGQGSIKKAVEAISEGALDFLEKPVQADRVEMLLKKLASLHRDAAA